MKDHGSLPSLASLRRALIRCAVAIGTLALGSCTFPDPFPDYAGTNLIAGFDFTLPANRATLDRNPAEAPFVSDADPLDVPAKWDWSWRGRTGDEFQYMDATVVPGAGPSGGDALRLEIVNLIDPAIGGGFELDSLGAAVNGAAFPSGWIIPSGWSTPAAPKAGAASPGTYAQASLRIIDDSSGVEGVINGHTLRLEADPAQAIALDPRLLINPLALGLDGQPYILHGNVSSSSAPYYSLMESSPVIDGYGYWDYSAYVAKGAGEVLTDGPFTIEDFLPSLWSGSPHRILFGSAFPTQASLDDLRIVRGLFPGYSLRILLRPGDTTPVLIPGRYRLGIHVKKPEGRRFPTETGTDEYASGRVVLELFQIYGTRSLLASASAVPTTEGATLTAEVELSTTIVIYPSGTSLPVLEIVITATDSLSSDAGAVIVADPTLTFLSGI